MWVRLWRKLERVGAGCNGMAIPVEITLPKSHKYLKKLPEVARHLSMSVRTLQNWHTSGQIRQTKNGYWSTRGIANLAIRKNEELRKEKDEEKEKPSGDKDELDLRLKRIKIEREEIQLAVERGSVVSKAEVEHQFIQKIMVLKRALLSMGRELASALCFQEDPKTVQSLIDDAVKYRIKVFALQDGDEGDE